ncbi:hypothetical protein [Tessaracoccus defluvii]|uniref:hypothetical protein n=1 Tax=Tessaracoccus defluvii TaxID=1285901 RepID=UPI0031E03025
MNGSVLPWVLVTATYTARNVGRSRKRHRALLDRLPRSEHAQDSAEVDEVGWGALRRLR